MLTSKTARAITVTIAACLVATAMITTACTPKPQPSQNDKPTPEPTSPPTNTPEVSYIISSDGTRIRVEHEPIPLTPYILRGSLHPRFVVSNSYVWNG